jgi:rhodanese-related sulfurtransferase
MYIELCNESIYSTHHFIKEENMIMVVKTISPQQLQQKVPQKDIYLLDVREPEEYHKEHILETHWFPLGNLLEGQTIPPNAAHLPMVIYCRSGKRSEKACLFLLEKNPHLDVSNLEGGFLAWKVSGGQVESK